jgi:hypothetical protein
VLVTHIRNHHFGVFVQVCVCVLLLMVYQIAQTFTPSTSNLCTRHPYLPCNEQAPYDPRSHRLKRSMRTKTRSLLTPWASILPQTRQMKGLLRLLKSSRKRPLCPLRLVTEPPYCCSNTTATSSSSLAKSYQHTLYVRARTGAKDHDMGKFHIST